MAVHITVILTRILISLRLLLQWMALKFSAADCWYA
jgi:hypothetical protein